MAQPETRAAARAKGRAKKEEGLPFTKKNYMIFVAGLAAIIIGYIALAQGSITLAPILLVVGYCVIVPIAILYREKESTEDPAPKSAG